MANSTEWSQVGIRTGLIEEVKEIISRRPDIGSASHYIDIAVRFQVERDKDEERRKEMSHAKYWPKEEAAQVVRPSASLGKE